MQGLRTPVGKMHFRNMPGMFSGGRAAMGTGCGERGCSFSALQIGKSGLEALIKGVVQFLEQLWRLVRVYLHSKQAVSSALAGRCGGAALVPEMGGCGSCSRGCRMGGRHKMQRSAFLCRLTVLLQQTDFHHRIGHD